MFLLFELVMRYCDYTTFKTCSLLNRECHRICKKLVPELKKVKNEKRWFESYETFWNGERQGLCYYINDTYFKIIDFDQGKNIATYRFNIVLETLIVGEIRYKATADFESQKVNFEKIPKYSRTEFSLLPVIHSSFFY